MAVQIPIQANPTGAIDAVRQIEAAIRAAGQEGRKFANLDLSHKELAPLADDIRTLSRHFKDLGEAGRTATAAAYRSIQNRAGASYDDILSWSQNVSQAFPNPTAAEQHRQAVLRYGVTFGTRWQQPFFQPPAGTVPAPGGGVILPSAAGAPPGGGMGPGIGGGGGPGGGLGGGGGQGGGGAGGGGGGGTGGGGGGGLGTALGTIVGGLKAGAGFGLALAGISGIKQVISESLGKAQEESEGNENLYRHSDGAKTFDELREAVRRSTEGLQLNYQEAQRLSLAWARITGDSSPGAISAGVRLGAGMGRAFGMDVGVATQALGQSVNMGMDPAKFAILIGEAANKGGRSADETTGALLRLSEAATRTLVTVSNEREAASMLAGLNAMGIPGLRGANAEAVMNTLGASISQGGNAGIASAALSFRTGRNQGVTDPYDLKYLQEGGLFANAKTDLGYGSGVSNFQARMEELQREYAGMPHNRLLNAMENDLGVNMRQANELLRYKPADLTTTLSALDDAHVKLQTMNPTGIADAVSIANADQGGLEDWRKRMLGRHGADALTGDEQARLSAAGPGDLKTILLQMVGIHGQNATEGTQTRESMAAISNALTKVGQDLLTPLNDLRDLVGTVVDEIGDIGSVLRDVYKASTGDVEARKRILDGKSGLGTSGQDEPGITDAIKKARADEAMSFFMSKGATRAEAAGYVANIQAESDFNVHGKKGDGGQAQEILQWHPDRAAKIAKHFGKPLSEMSYHEQLEAIWWETHGGDESAAGEAMHKAGSGYEAARIASTDYVRPRDPLRYVAHQRARAGEAIEADNKRVEGQVIIRHQDMQGNDLHTQQLPITDVPAPTSWGPAGKGGPRVAPPPPPKLNLQAQFWGGAA